MSPFPVHQLLSEISFLLLHNQLLHFFLPHSFEQLFHRVFFAEWLFSLRFFLLLPKFETPAPMAPLDRALFPATFEKLVLSVDKELFETGLPVFAFPLGLIISNSQLFKPVAPDRCLLVLVLPH